MNLQSIARAYPSPLQVRQGLFAMLALLITLLACQQYLRWTAAPELIVQSQHRPGPSLAHFNAAAPVGTEVKGMSMHQAGDVVADQQAPRQPRWVF